MDKTPVNRVRFYSMVEAMYEDGLTYKEPLNIGSIDLNRPRRNTIAFSRTARGIVNNYKLCNNSFENYACSGKKIYYREFMLFTPIEYNKLYVLS